MGNTGKDGFCTASITKIKQKCFDHKVVQLPRSTSAACTDTDSIRSQIKKMGPICKSRAKTIEEDIDLNLDEQIANERCSDDDECMWLSSAGSSPSSFFENYRLSSSLHISVDDWLISWLSTLATSYVHLDKGSNLRVNPEEEASLVAWRTTPVKEIISPCEDLKGSPKKSDVNNAPDSFITNSDSFRSSLRHCSEEFSSFDKSSTPCSTIFDSSLSSQISDSDRAIFLVSLVNLDSEDSKQISETELEMDDLPSGLPSPRCGSSSYNDSTPSEAGHENTRHGMFSEHAYSDSVDMEDFKIDEPLFWPSECKHDWSSEETWKCFTMSPRKYSTLLGMPQDTSFKSVKPKFHVLKTGLEKGCRRRLKFGSGSTAAPKILEQKQRSNNRTKKINPATGTTPSRLRKSTKNSVKIVPTDMEDNTDETESKEVKITKLKSRDKELLEDDIISNEELPIETILGLAEFDGHEGVDSEFNGDVFRLEDHS